MGQRKVTQGLVPRIAIGVFGLLTVAMILLAVFDERGALALGSRGQELEDLTGDIDTITGQNERARKEIEDLRHNREAIERRAREQLKLVKPGEIVIQTPEPVAPPPSKQPDDSR